MGRKLKSKDSIIITPYRRYPRGSQPPYLYPPYRLTLSRAPRKPLIVLPHTLSEITGPVFGHDDVRETDNDLTRQHAGEPLGERITVSGRVLDDNGRPVPNTLIELWQCNAAGRYRHRIDQHQAPLDPNFSGAGRTLTDTQGNYRFLTIKPGPYPWTTILTRGVPRIFISRSTARRSPRGSSLKCIFRAIRCFRFAQFSIRFLTRRGASA